MPDETGGYAAPKLTGYSAEFVQQESGLAAGSAQEQVCITLHGDNFITRAMMLIVQIGDTWVQNKRISDPQTIVCYLDELPEEGARICVCYSGDEPVELEERFSHSKVSGAGESDTS